MTYEIKTPVTYKLHFEHHGGFRWHKTAYYSLQRAVNFYFYYRDKLKNEYVVRIFAFKGESKLCDITSQVKECLNSVN